jgi:hypothetical protein
MGWTSEPEDERLLLDLLNSTPVGPHGIVDELATDPSATAWARERGGTGTPGEAGELRRMRELLQSVVSGDAPAEVLEPAVRDVRLVPRIGAAGLDWRPEVPDPDRRLAVRALLAWADVVERVPGRLRACANPDCRLYLLDRSRAGTARWCSMSSCGNRMKARRHYRRAQES